MPEQSAPGEGCRDATLPSGETCDHYLHVEAKGDRGGGAGSPTPQLDEARFLLLPGLGFGGCCLDAMNSASLSAVQCL